MLCWLLREIYQVGQLLQTPTPVAGPQLPASSLQRSCGAIVVGAEQHGAGARHGGGGAAPACDGTRSCSGEKEEIEIGREDMELGCIQRQIKVDLLWGAQAEPARLV
ncbi:hypothetical protein E2562_010217 [Oryza meyeriana var. granulata]|uniref:Uncharacterized protein n=1 Tax=Oryza meyeriana var. granulata TaxID=110450 RepID=A0A6G1EJN1_9ORYZ|nr:hypothetical protein E2562_010217 [Oryza meyeriana var. granulata]